MAQLSKKTESDSIQMNTDKQTTDAPANVATLPNRYAAPTILQDDLDQFAGAGTSDRREDNTVPFLNVLQKGSPQVNDKKSDHIPGAKPGMLFNTATKTLYDAERPDAGPLALQGYMEVCEVEWVPRSAGGGFIAQHPLDTPLLQQVTEVPDPQNGSVRRMLPNGHQLVTTAYHYLILAETLEPVVVPLTSTGLRTHRDWNTMLRNKKVRNGQGRLVIAPSFSTVVRLSTVWQENDKGDWFTLKVTDMGWVSDAEVYSEAKEFHKLALTEGVRTATPTEDGGAPVGPTIQGHRVDDGSAAHEPMTDEIPF